MHYAANLKGCETDHFYRVLRKYFLLSGNGISRISSISFNCRKSIFFAEFGAQFVLKYATKILKIG